MISASLIVLLVITDKPIKAEQRGAESSPDSDTHRYAMDFFAHLPKPAIIGWKICRAHVAVFLFCSFLSLLYLLFCFIALHDIA